MSKHGVGTTDWWRINTPQALNLVVRFACSDMRGLSGFGNPILQHGQSVLQTEIKTIITECFNVDCCLESALADVSAPPSALCLEGDKPSNALENLRTVLAYDGVEVRRHFGPGWPLENANSLRDPNCEIRKRLRGGGDNKPGRQLVAKLTKHSMANTLAEAMGYTNGNLV